MLLAAMMIGNAVRMTDVKIGTVKVIAVTDVIAVIAVKTHLDATHPSELQRLKRYDRVG
jgi:ABC-type transporter Mla subunit MlaD